jgi:putative hydrolase of the HAD superfamily
MNLSNDIKAVYFDFGDTLAVLEPQKEDLFIAAARKIGLELDKANVKRAYECVDAFVKFSSISINEDSGRSEFYRIYNEHLCEALGISSSFTNLWPIIAGIFSRNTKWRLIEGALETLLSFWDRGIRLAVIANWDKNLGNLMQGLGIRGFFECVVSSQEAMVEKPDPAIFRIALRAMSLLEYPDSVAYVGNEYRADIVGARSAGLIPCLLDVDNRYPYADCRRIASIRELLSMINKVRV